MSLLRLTMAQYKGPFSLGALSVLIGMAACGDKLPGPPSLPYASPLPITIPTGGYSITGSLTQNGVPASSFDFTLTIANTTPIAKTVDYYGGCWGYVQFYSSPDRSGKPIFDSGAIAGTTCETSIHKNLPLAPYDTVRLTGNQTLAQIVFVGVPSGHYYVGIRASPDGTASIISAGEIDVPR